MNPLIQKLMSGANLDENVAGKVVGIVSSFLEEKLPEPAKSLATKVIKGGEAAGDTAKDAAEGVMNKVGDLF